MLRKKTNRVKQYLLRSRNPWTVGSVDISLLSWYHRVHKQLAIVLKKIYYYQSN